MSYAKRYINFSIGMLNCIITFIVAVGLNILCSIHHFNNFKIHDNIKTYILHVTAEKDIDIGSKKIDELFSDTMKSSLNYYKIKHKDKNSDIEITVKVDKFNTEKVLGTDNKINVSIDGKISLKNIHNENKDFSDKTFHESIEINEKDKDKKLDNAKKIIEIYCKKFIESNLGVN